MARGRGVQGLPLPLGAMAPVPQSPALGGRLGLREQRGAFGTDPSHPAPASSSHPPRPGVTATGCPLPGNSTLQARQSPRLADEWRQRHTQVLPESSWPCSAHSAPSVPQGSSLQVTPRSRPRPRVDKRWAQASNLPTAPLQPPECGRQTGRRNIRLFCLVASDILSVCRGL